MPRQASKSMRDSLATAAEEHDKRAEYEASRPYSGWGETPEAIAAYWRGRAESSRALLAALSR